MQKPLIVSLTPAEVSFLEQALQAMDSADVNRGGSRNYRLEDQLTAMRRKLRPLPMPECSSCKSDMPSYVRTDIVDAGTFQEPGPPF